MLRGEVSDACGLTDPKAYPENDPNNGCEAFLSRLAASFNTQTSTWRQLTVRSVNSGGDDVVVDTDDVLVDNVSLGQYINNQPSYGTHVKYLLHFHEVGTDWRFSKFTISAKG